MQYLGYPISALIKDLNFFILKCAGEENISESSHALSRSQGTLCLLVVATPQVSGSDSRVKCMLLQGKL